MENKCPQCKCGTVPHFLEVCLKCAYPEYDQVHWKNVVEGAIVWIAGNDSTSGVMLPRAYGPHIVKDVKKRVLISGNWYPEDSRTFNHPEEYLLVKREV